MLEHVLVSLTAIAVLAISAQWLGWRSGIPSILLLLVFGIVAGPVTGWLDPDTLLGDLLYPICSLGVAIILFEGGLSLSLQEFRAVGTVAFRLVTIGALVSWVLASFFAWLFVDLSPALAVLLGGVLVVTGPTVIIPMLRHIRPAGQVGPILKWEGIVIDPIGAMLAVLVFQLILATDGSVGSVAALVIGKTLLVGVVVGLLAAWMLVLIIERDWAPDYLQNPIALMFVLAAFTGSNLLQHESGLLTVTVMGFALANQSRVPITHIAEFKENLQVLLIGTIFILLAAHLDRPTIAQIGFGTILFLLALVLIVRPASVFVATVGTRLDTNEKLFLSAVAPRGIVAAAVASVFALRLEEIGVPGAQSLISTTFTVIIGTVVIYGALAGYAARRLGLAKEEPQGVLLLGGRPWVRAIAKALLDEGFPVMLVDNVRANVRAARLEGIPAHYTSVFSDAVLEQVELGGIGKLLALDANDDVNSLAALHFAPVFGRNNIFQLAPEERSDGTGPVQREHLRAEDTRHLRARTAFERGMTHSKLTVRYAAGWVIKKVRLTEEFGYDKFLAHYNGEAVPLFWISGGRLNVVAADSKPNFAPGTTLIALVKPPRDEKAKGAS